MTEHAANIRLDDWVAAFAGPYMALVTARMLWNMSS